MNKYLMDKNQYFSILKQLHDICRELPMPKLVGMEAYNEIMNYLWLRHSSDDSKDDKLRELYNNYCTDKHILQDQKNLELNKVGSKSGIKQELFFEKLSDELLPGLVDQKRNEKIAFVSIMGDNIINCKLDIGRLTVILHKDDGSTISDGGMKAQKLINKIYKNDFLPLQNEKFNIELFPYDAVGEGFEKFMSDAGSSGGNWGQFFTNPQVGDWIVKKAMIKQKDIIGDIFAGSGGLILNAKKTTKINPENIYAHESDDKIFKFLRFNAQIAGLTLDNITKGDSYDYSEYLKKHEEFFDKLILNPPYGESIDILLSTEAKAKFWGIMKAGKKTIKDSMGLAVYVMYKLLKVGGIASFVSERGFLNNGTENKSWQKKLRKFIVENTSITEILLLPKGIFAHTNFDTCCICFEKGKRTDKIVFSQGYFKDEDKGKGDKKMYIDENILTITFEDIVNKDWSLKYDDYIEKKDEQYNGILYKTLGEVCEHEFGKRVTNTKDGVKSDYNGTKYNVYGGGGATFQVNNFNREKGTLIISRFGVSTNCIRIVDEQFWLHDNGMSLKYKLNNKKFIYYYLLIKQYYIYNNYTTHNAQARMNTNNLFRELLIPILPSDHQQRIVDYMDKTFGSDYKKLDKIVSKFKDYDLFKILLNENYNDFDELLVTYEDILNSEAMLKRMETKYKLLLIQRCFDTVKGKEMKLGELVDYEYGTRVTNTKDGIKSNYNGNKYNVYGGGGATFQVNKFNRVKETLIMSRFGVSPNCIRIVNEDFFLNDSGMSLKYKNNINKEFMNKYLLNNQNRIYKYAEGQGQKNMQTVKLFRELKVLVPTPEDQEKVVKMIQDINNEESEFNNSIKSLKSIITNLYHCVEQYTKLEAVDISDNVEEDDVEDGEDVEDNEDNVEEYDELEQVEIKGKTYLSDGTNIYRINKDESKGELYGNLIDGKFKKIKS